VKAGTLYRIDVPYFCCGVVVDRGIVVEAAPIIGWAIGKPESALRNFVKRKGGKMEVVKEAS
jgi:hypothetical protein